MFGLLWCAIDMWGNIANLGGIQWPKNKIKVVNCQFVTISQRAYMIFLSGYIGVCKAIHVKWVCSINFLAIPTSQLLYLSLE